MEKEIRDLQYQSSFCGRASVQGKAMVSVANQFLPMIFNGKFKRLLLLQFRNR
jgi:hypothetical protein